GAGWKEVIFDQLATGRYVKFTALSEINGSIYTSMAELALLNRVPLPERPIGVSASSLNDSTIMLRWTDNSDNESGFIIEQQIDDLFVSIDTIQRNKTGYIHTGLADSSTYTYRVRAYNQGGASEPSEIVEATTPLKVGVGEQEFNWNLYPNPFTDHFTLQLPGNKENLRLKVSDQNGRIVISQKLTETETQFRIETGELPAGLYIVEISGEKLHYSRKIIKQ
ncbi:MAG: T9SS type A sorting domain-containing protein, partial [Prolixibacteraceae bacterium]|nr:T9SS type A sorting domain-containing protein [Prolixibacteraceae bacterium]